MTVWYTVISVCPPPCLCSKHVAGARGGPSRMHAAVAGTSGPIHDGQRISATRIGSGEIDAHGRLLE
ncbi:hypothetical protein AArc1_1094 [Natrarchaeobaculum sulfurireducens]|uniref:Uncharacterized protein n=1 Tax=Natrarchaeobaculum sulfurireducens TaxID=2044521 RepID=A0A346PD40_9EURY|nr:hypothetical protein AArc1_1094 [Natrarchaeobaculum sulfurireducens]